MLLYTESMEVVSPLVEAASEPKSSALGEEALETPVSSWAVRWSNRWVEPRLELGLSLGSDSFTVVSARKMTSAPAKVAIRTAKRKAILFGKEAEAIEGREPEGVEVVRPIFAGAVSDRRLAGKLLASVVTSCRSRWQGTAGVAVAVPSDLSAVDSQTLVATVKSAGARSVHLVDQALVAAIGCGFDLKQARGRLVVHAGAGVVDIAVLSLAATVLSRTTRTAGDALNEAIRDYVRYHHKLLIDDRQAERIKREIGSAIPLPQSTELTVYGRDLVEGKPSQREVSSTEIDQVLEPLLARIAQEVREVVASMPVALLGDLRDKGAILTGGLAHLRRFDEFLSLRTRLPFEVPKEPESSVALGMRRLLREPSLRQAVLGKRAKVARGQPEPDRASGGTGLMGALILTAGLALLTQSLPALGQGVAGHLEGYLGGMLTPSVPLVATWDEQAQQPSKALSAQSSFQGRRMSELEAENARLRKMLKAPLNKQARDPIAGDVVARDPRGWMRSMTLNVGSAEGVEPGMAVTDGVNLVGLVDKVESRRSQVRLFTDAKSVVAARVRLTRGSGVAVGTGLDRLEMRYLDPDSGVRRGDWVVTSGLDRTYPPGLKLGWVSEVTQPSGQNTLTAVVQPAMNIHQLQNVLVLRR